MIVTLVSMLTMLDHLFVHDALVVLIQLLRHLRSVLDGNSHHCQCVREWPIGYLFHVMVSDPGTYTAIDGSTKCSECDIGYYQDAAAQSTCFACPTGQSAPTTARSSCLLCAAGFFANTTASANCF